MRKNFLPITILIFITFQLRSQDKLSQRLEVSPRHHEWVEIQAGDKILKAFMVYPEVSEKAKTVIVIHENRGLTDWVRNFADQLAEAGFIALAPDMLSDFSEEFTQTADFESSDDARNGIYKLEAEQVSEFLDKSFTYLKALPAGNGEVAVLGFCWGGSQSFRYATTNPDLSEALVFYGTGPKAAADYQPIETSVYGFYGGNDQRVNATIDASTQAMKEFNKVYQYEIYEGAGHAFMRSGDDPAGAEANIKARNESWERLVKVLGE